MFSLIANILIGIAVLTLGRKLFWVFVGAAGFVLGSSLAAQFLSGRPEWMVVATALAAGVVGLLLAIFLQRLAVGIAGFVMGSYALASLFLAVGLSGKGWLWLALVGGGIVGAALVLAMFDLALIALSCLVGAELIVQATDFSPLVTFLLFVVLVVVGAAIQTGMLRKDKYKEHHHLNGA